MTDTTLIEIADWAHRTADEISPLSLPLVGG